MLARIAVCFAVASIVIEARADESAAAGWDGPDDDADHARWEQAWLDGHSRRATGGEPGSARRARRSPDTSATEMAGLPDGSARTFSAAGPAGNDEASPSRECGVASNCGGLGGWRVILLATQADAPMGSDPSATEPVEDPDEPVQNLAPDRVGSINDRTLTVGGEPARVDAARYFSDPDGDDLTYQASSSDDGVATVTVSGSDVTVAPGVEGTATITVTARDPGGLMAEQTFEVTVSSAGAADLVVESPGVTEANPDPGGSITLSATVRNRGDAESGATTLRYYRSSNSTISSGDTEVGTDPVAALGAGRSGDESIPLTVPSSPGTYYYGACVDAVSGELNTSNNCSDGIAVEVSGGAGDSYGAISYDFNVSDDCPGLAAGIANNRPSAVEASDAARAACRADGGSAFECREETTVFEGCAAMVYGSLPGSSCTVYVYVNDSSGATRSGVESTALSECRLEGNSVCRVWSNGNGARISGCNTRASGVALPVLPSRGFTSGGVRSKRDPRR